MTRTAGQTASATYYTNDQWRSWILLLSLIFLSLFFPKWSFLSRKSIRDIKVSGFNGNNHELVFRFVGMQLSSDTIHFLRTAAVQTHREQRSPPRPRSNGKFSFCPSKVEDSKSDPVFEVWPPLLAYSHSGRHRSIPLPLCRFPKPREYSIIVTRQKQKAARMITKN